MMITLYVLFYVGYRADDASYIINIIPFKGEIKTVLNDFSELIVMRTIGNIAFYSTLSLSSASFAKKNSSLWAFLAPFILCIVTETAQGIFSMGDADIDDVILNVDEAIRVMVYLNGEQNVYAKLNGFTEEPEEDTKAFYDDGTVMLECREDFAPGDIDRFTIVIFIEGDDPDCTNALLGGEMKMHMEITEEHIEQKNSKNKKK